MTTSSSRVQAVGRNSSMAVSTEELVKTPAGRAHPRRFWVRGDLHSSPAPHSSLMVLKQCLDLENTGFWQWQDIGHRQMLCHIAGW